LGVNRSKAQDLLADAVLIVAEKSRFRDKPLVDRLVYFGISPVTTLRSMADMAEKIPDRWPTTSKFRSPECTWFDFSDLLIAEGSDAGD
jgi:hypothetical protein